MRNQLQNHRMIEENTSYRRLRNRHFKKVQGISQSLLQIPTHRKAASSLKGSKYDVDITNKNVSMYEYMLAKNYIKQNYIKWAINLRDYSKNKDKGLESSQKQLDQESTSCEPFKVFYKSTKLKDLRDQAFTSIRNTYSSDNLAVNTGEYSQYFAKDRPRQDCYSSSLSDIAYMNNLRNYPDSIEKLGSKKRPKFRNLPAKDKNQYPKFLKKTALKKLRDISNEDKQNGLDGTHKYPAYSYNILREKNISLLNPLVKSGQKVSLPSLSWAVGLRAYQKQQNNKLNQAQVK